MARQAATKLLPRLNLKELQILVAALYWAEGSKRDFSFCNTDPRMVRVFVNGLRKGFGIRDENIKISIRVYEDLDVAKCLEFWSRVTGIKLGSETGVEVLYGRKNGKLLHGMCRVRVKNGGKFVNEWQWVAARLDKLTSPRSSMDRTLAS